MIVTLAEARSYLRLDSDTETALLNTLITAAETYLYNATGTTFNQNQPLAKLFVLILVADWFENREAVGHVTQKTREAVQSILTQLKYCYRGEGYTFDTYSREWVQAIPEGDRT
jgi:uncharacterized phage protein (predicted DNA packaging)